MSARAFCLAVGLMLAAATAHANSPIEFDQDNSGSISFETPSGNIGCGWGQKLHQPTGIGATDGELVEIAFFAHQGLNQKWVYARSF